MVCSADDLLGWKDFPKGLRVLLLHEDNISASEIKSKLEEMDYIVSVFFNENEALEAISNEPDGFHVAIVEVSPGDNHGSFKFLEMAKDLPTIMISSAHCLSTTMKCIAMGAAEFLQKPLSEDKLRNMWQHVVHKAFNAGGAVPKSLRPIKETVASILQLESETIKDENQNPSKTGNSGPADKNSQEQSVTSDRYPAPSTPQLECGRSSDPELCQDQPNCSVKKESKEHDRESTDLRKIKSLESKSVENTCANEVSAVKADSCSGEPGMEEEVDSADGSKSDECNANRGSTVSSHSQNADNVESGTEDGNQNKASPLPNLCGSKANRKKMKVDWTPELHRRFVQAVEQLGIDQAIPSKILELMKVEGLTRHNIASHLQKYRMHRRQILPKDDSKWQLQRDPMQRNCMHQPVMAFPPYNSNQIYPVWGHPSGPPSAMQMWGHPSFPIWHAPDSWQWRTYPGMHADAWGCPVLPSHAHLLPKSSAGGYGFTESGNDFYSSAEEVIDKVVKEVISQPWLPLPLGLKPPAAESVLSELHRCTTKDARRGRWRA